MNNKTFRAFFAIDPPEETKKIITNFIELLKKAPAYKNIKWSKPENLHLTLCFLGNITEVQAKTIGDKVADKIKKLKPATLELVSCQLFPNPKKPLALALIPKHSNQLEEFATIIKQSAIESGIEVEKRKYRPHVTIGKTKPIALANHANNTKIAPINFKTDKIKLFQRNISNKNSKYITKKII